MYLSHQRYDNAQNPPGLLAAGVMVASAFSALTHAPHRIIADKHLFLSRTRMNSRNCDLLVASCDGVGYEFDINFERDAPMTVSRTILSQISINELPRPDGESAGLVATSLPRPLPKVTDTGRISFGAGLRILSK